MDNIAFLIFVLIVVIIGAPVLFFFLLRIHISNKFEDLDRKLRSLEEKLDQKGKTEPEQKAREQRTPTPEQPPQNQQPQQPPPTKAPHPSQTTPQPSQQPQQTQSQQPRPRPSQKPGSVQQQRVQQPPPSQPAPPKKEKVKAKGNLEKFVGENLINKIGIGILVLGIAFFVRYAIANDWINEIGRVFIGILSGGGLIAIAHRLRKRYKAFSSVLVGGGLALLYFTIAIAFHEYGLFSQTGAFLIMVVITAFAVFLSILYDRQELAILSIVGGFATPFLVSTGKGNYIVLFTYLSILNMGMLSLAMFRKWPLVNIISYLFTAVIFGGWLYNEIQLPGRIGNKVPFKGAFIFATVFFLIFFLMNIANNVRAGKRFKPIEFTILLSNNLLYFAAGLYILEGIHDGFFQGVFTLGIGALNLVFALILYKKWEVDPNLIYLLIGAVLTFLSLFAPIQMDGNRITLFWAAEGVILLWLSQTSGIRILKTGSLVVTILMLITLIRDWDGFYLTKSHYELLPFFNQAFLTGSVAMISLFLAGNLFNREKNTLWKIQPSTWSIVYRSLLGIGVYLTLLFEIEMQLKSLGIDHHGQTLFLGTYNYLYFATILFILWRKSGQIVNSIFTSLGTLPLFLFPVGYHLSMAGIRERFALGSASMTEFLAQYAIVIALALFYLLFHRNVIRLTAPGAGLRKAFYWFATLLGVYVASVQLDTHVVMIGADNPPEIARLVEANIKVGYPILWGSISFVMMILGMKKGIKDLRIISLALFFITLAKLFIYDIRDIPEAGKIAAFISLGVLLLVISFMYQKLKQILFPEDKEEKQNS